MIDKKQGLFGIKDGIYLIIAPLVIILPISYWYFTAPPPGWCEAQKRVLPNSEYHKFAEDIAIDCCAVQRMESDFLSKILRLDQGVSISYRYERTQESRSKYDPEDKFYGVIKNIDSCATVVWDDWGITEK